MDRFQKLPQSSNRRTVGDVRELLASGPVQFVVADVGVAPQWIRASECFDFWKQEASRT
jgi:hypothetical protein